MTAMSIVAQFRLFNGVSFKAEPRLSNAWWAIHEPQRWSVWAELSDDDESEFILHASLYNFKNMSQKLRREKQELELRIKWGLIKSADPTVSALACSQMLARPHLELNIINRCILV